MLTNEEIMLRFMNICNNFRLKWSKSLQDKFIPNEKKFDEWIAKERRDAPKYGGRTVFDAIKKKKKGGNNQLELF